MSGDSFGPLNVNGSSMLAGAATTHAEGLRLSMKGPGSALLIGRKYKGAARRSPEDMSLFAGYLPVRSNLVTAASLCRHCHRPVAGTVQGCVAESLRLLNTTKPALEIMSSDLSV